MSAEAAAADFARRFAEYWRAPTPEGLDRVLAERTRLVAPMTPTTHTLEEGKRAFAELFELIDGMTAEVHRWGPTEEGVLIDFTLTGSVGGTAISWPAIDRIVLGEDGLARERVSRFDSLPLVLAVVRSPRAWLPFARSRLSG
jgi:hypothetical protein